MSARKVEAEPRDSEAGPHTATEPGAEPESEPEAAAEPHVARETDAATEPEAAAEAAAPEPEASPEHRFFSWMRALGIVRRPGWVGGVCAGIADRIGIDPVVVRGIVVVIAVLGGPMLLLYAAAWLLLPDREERIHLRELGRGRPGAAIAGIGVLVLASLLPVAQGFWWLGAMYWGEPHWSEALIRAFWTLLVLALMVLLVVIVAHGQSREPRVVPATTDDQPHTVPAPTEPRPDAALAAASPVTVAALAAASPVTVAALAQPQSPAQDAPAEDVAAWRQQQEAWRQHHAQLREQQQSAEKELRRRRAEEARELARAESARAAERRRQRRLAHPRLNAPLTFLVIGAAVLAGAIAALLVSTVPALRGSELVTGLAAGTLGLGLGIVSAGAFRRRSGVLGFLAVLSVLGMLAAAVVPADRTLLWPGAWLWQISDGRYAQPLGQLNISIDQYSGHGVIDVWQGNGSVEIFIAEGSAARLQLASPEGTAQLKGRSYDEQNYWGDQTELLYGPRSDGSASLLVGEPDDPAVTTVRIWQHSGYILVYDENLRPDAQPHDAPDGAEPQSTPTPIPEQEARP